MRDVIEQFMGKTLLKPDKVQAALEKRGFKSLAALENFNEADFRKLMDAVLTNDDLPEIRAFLNNANASVEQFKQQAEAAYDATMTKFQNLYAKKNKLAVVVLSFAVVLALNASVIKLYDILSVNQAMSQTIAATLATIGQTNPGTGGTQGLDPQKARDAIAKELQDYPILVRTLKYPEDIKDPGNDIGLILMGLLVSLGAPFWNDVLKGTNGLNNVLNTRGETKPAGN